MAARGGGGGEKKKVNNLIWLKKLQNEQDTSSSEERQSECNQITLWFPFTTAVNAVFFENLFYNFRPQIGLGFSLMWQRAA